MLSVEEVKKLIKDPKLSDTEIEKIRDDMYVLAEIIFDSWLEKRKREKSQK